MVDKIDDDRRIMDALKGKAVKLTSDDKKRLPWDQKKQYAKDMFWEYNSMAAISRELDIKLPTLKGWVYGNNQKGAGWKVDRELAKNQLLKDLTADKRGMIYNMVDDTMFLLHDYVKNARQTAVKSGEPVTLKEAKELTGILERLHNIVEKDDGADDSDFDRPSTPQELRKRVAKADPFASDEEKNELIDDEDDEIIIEE